MISIREILKAVENIIIVFCAMLLTTVFLNYRLDLPSIAGAVSDRFAQIVYDGQLSMSNMMVVLCGGVLGSLAVLMLVFSVGRYIDKNRANMGVLKALGYGNASIALRFAKFGCGIFVGAATGCAAGYAFAPVMYSVMGESLPSVSVGFHLSVPLLLVVMPTALFSLLAFVAALVKLRKPPLAMIQGEKAGKFGSLNARWQKKVSAAAFPQIIRRSMLLSSLLLIFFVGFASFAFSAELQMAFVMRDLEMSVFFSVMMIVLAVVMGGTMLMLAFRFVFNSHDKYVSLMKAYGYSVRECRGALFGGYRLVSYIGFALGSVYQFFIMSIVVSFFGDAYDVSVNFSVPGFFITLAAFLVCYEAIMYFYLRRINGLPLGRVMQA